MLSDKLAKRLRSIESFTDNVSGMYPGDYWDSASKQHRQLENLGYVQVYFPHNSVHKDRVIITDEGREALEQLIN